MNREKGNYGGTVEKQSELAERALGRAVTRQSQIFQSGQVSEVLGGNPTGQTADAVLSWASGNLHLSPGGPPFSSEVARAAAVSAPSIERGEVSPVPSRLGATLTSSPRCVESNSGAAQSSRDLFRKG